MKTREHSDYANHDNPASYGESQAMRGCKNRIRLFVDETGNACFVRARKGNKETIVFGQLLGERSPYEPDMVTVQHAHRHDYPLAPEDIVLPPGYTLDPATGVATKVVHNPDGSLLMRLTTEEVFLK